MPQRKGEVSPAHANRLKEAVVALEAAQLERDAAIVAALKAGGSAREVGLIIGLTHVAVANVGHKHGWPTEAQKRAAAEHKERIAADRKWIDDALAKLRAEHEPDGT